MKKYSNSIRDHAYLNRNVDIDLMKLVSSDDQVNASGYYVVQCPLCMEELDEFGRKLYIKQDFSCGHCHRCGSNFFQIQADPNSKDYKLKLNLNIESTSSFSEYKIDCKFYHDSNEFSEEGVNYLNSRRFGLGDNYSKIGIKFRDDLVVIPFFRSGDINDEVLSYQSRTISQKSYYIPRSDHKLIYVSPTGNIKSTKIIISEGVFGALAISDRWPNYNSIAVLGSYITSYQIYQLSLLKPTEFILYFDRLEISTSVKSNLSKYFPGIKISILESPYHDPEDDSVHGVYPILHEESDPYDINLMFKKALGDERFR